MQFEVGLSISILRNRGTLDKKIGVGNQKVSEKVTDF
jgi:hypothetical protein